MAEWLVNEETDDDCTPSNRKESGGVTFGALRLVRCYRSAPSDGARRIAYNLQAASTITYFVSEYFVEVASAMAQENVSNGDVVIERTNRP